MLKSLTKVYNYLLLKHPSCSIKTKSYTEFATTHADKLRGILPSLTTPFKRSKDESVSWKDFEENLIRMNYSHKFTGYHVNGFYGENIYLTHQERTEVVKTTRKIVGNKKTILAGVDSESLKKTIESCESMKSCGADYCVIHTPHFYKMRMSYTATFDFYTLIADRSPLPILIDNAPSLTYIDLPIEICMELAQHPNIVGLKESAHNLAKIAHICEVMRQTGNDFSVLSGSAYFLLDALKVGAIGSISALANILGDKLIQIYEFYEKDKHLNKASGKKKHFLEKAYHLQNQLVQPDLAIIETYGVPGIKAALDAYGYYGGPCRMPLLELSETDLNKLKSIFEQNGFSWNDSTNQSIFTNRISYTIPLYS